MPAAAARATLALLLAAVLAPASRAEPLPARALVDSVASHYARMPAYHFRGTSSMTLTSESGEVRPATETPFEFAARWPSRVHCRILSPGQPIEFVADGESLLIVAPGLGQYMKRAAPRVVPGQPARDEYETAVQPLRGIAGIAEGIVTATDLGEDTVMTSGGPVRCRKLGVEYPPDTTRRGLTALPRTMWIDPATLLLWRDVATMRMEQDGRPAMTSVQTMRFTHADLGGGPDSLYRLVPVAGMQRVERFGPPPPPPPAIVGKPAKDFTLPTLTGTKVRLGALRGKVVVLDFWATWCGPCRRWMPIVSKVEQALKGRDVRFFAVNERDTPEKVREYLATAGTRVPVLLDRDGAVGLAYDAASIPLTVVVGRDGKVVEALVGLHPEEDLRAALRKAGVTGI